MEKSMECFEIALTDCDTVPDYLYKAIRMTKNYPELCGQISWWRDGFWGLVEDFLNTHPKKVDMEYFERGCALLGED